MTIHNILRVLVCISSSLKVAVFTAVKLLSYKNAVFLPMPQLYMLGLFPIFITTLLDMYSPNI